MTKIDWLLDADPSIRWQVMKDILSLAESEYEPERKRISVQGWGKRLLDLQDEAGTWAGAIYSPKWISTTYTLLLLRSFGLDGHNEQAQKTSLILLDKGFYPDGGINFFASLNHSETCVTAMVLALLCHFNMQDPRIKQLYEWLLSQQMEDGGWNCMSFNGDTHSSFHTTLTVLEGLEAYRLKNKEEAKRILKARAEAHEFLLQHKLFRSDHTGQIVDAKFTRFSFPCRWRYDVLRALDYFQLVNAEKDSRFQDAIDLVYKKRTKEGVWKLQNKHPGRVYFEMEQVGEASRWNTLRALRVLKWWE